MRPTASPTSTPPRPHRARLRTLSLFAVGALFVTAIPALAASSAPGCDQPLAVLSPTGSSGDLGAVAVTSQVLEQGVDGWAEVGWETFGDTELDSVTIVRSDGEEVRTGDLATGTASDVRELIFCGSTGGR